MNAILAALGKSVGGVGGWLLTQLMDYFLDIITDLVQKMIALQKINAELSAEKKELHAKIEKLKAAVTAEEQEAAADDLFNRPRHS